MMKRVRIQANEIKSIMKDKNILKEFEEIQTSSFLSKFTKKKLSISLLVREGLIKDERKHLISTVRILACLGDKQSIRIVKTANKISRNQYQRRLLRKKVEKKIKVEVGDSFYISNTHNSSYDVAYTITTESSNLAKGLLNHKTLIANTVLGKRLNEMTGYIVNNVIETGRISIIQKSN